MEEADKLQTALNALVDNSVSRLVKSFTDKYGNEEVVKKYVNLKLNGKEKEAEKLVKQLENG